MKTFTLTSTHGRLIAGENGEVLVCRLDPNTFGTLPVWINVWEWHLRYPDDDLTSADTHDILDFGYIDARGRYKEPCEDWRKVYADYQN